MLIVESYGLAVALCVVTMLCWGSWANTQKLASKDWRFQLFYWDYAIGVFLFALLLALTAGSMGEAGRSFMADLRQAERSSLQSAFLGGVVFNLANILLVAAIDIAGMAVAFPIGIGLALVLGVVTNHLATPVGNAAILFLGVGGVVLAILFSAAAYRRLPVEGPKTTGKGIALSVGAPSTGSSPPRCPPTSRTSTRASSGRTARSWFSRSESCCRISCGTRS
jgi:glucose uptake protein